MEGFYWLSLSESKIKNDFDIIKNDVIEDTELKGVLSIESADDLVRIIKAFKKASISSSEDKYFKSEKHKIGFMLLKHEGSVFDEELGIKKKHYLNKEVAKEWKQKYQSIYHPDKNVGDSSIDYAEVTSKINKIYNRMVGKA
ncbi:hypothetical protein I6M59_15705 [Shewanella algae]|uniref:hypothetical protein n=1 Tax=Gammaproteobacteria TaxID=1236 RepID=UPI001AAD8BFB|nr:MULTISPECIES: hypothetical protein [Gammaproteobacteria]MBO2693170.1 hypothetical protein [Shewanella algae]MCR9833844.1 hypothetical protein [Vibrio parahaemolyticus]MDV2964131.1 hypothetical protein [Shewanella algae]QTE89797.1 hypothetical protein JKK33_15650 [Shewanella algae]